MDLLERGYPSQCSSSWSAPFYCWGYDLELRGYNFVSRMERPCHRDLAALARYSPKYGHTQDKVSAMRQYWTRIENKQLFLAGVFVLIVAQFLTWGHPLGSWPSRTGLILEAGVVFSGLFWRWRRKSS